jgi:hypothetical protein
MSKRRKLQKSVEKPLPIIVVPDKSYIDDTGNVIPTDVILISDPTMYEKMKAVLGIWGKEEMGVPGQSRFIEIQNHIRGVLDG